MLNKFTCPVNYKVQYVDLSWLHASCNRFHTNKNSSCAGMYKKIFVKSVDTLSGEVTLGSSYSSYWAPVIKLSEYCQEIQIGSDGVLVPISYKCLLTHDTFLVWFLKESLLWFVRNALWSH